MGRTAAATLPSPRIVAMVHWGHCGWPLRMPIRARRAATEPAKRAPTGTGPKSPARGPETSLARMRALPVGPLGDGSARTPATRRPGPSKRTGLLAPARLMPPRAMPVAGGPLRLQTLGPGRAGALEPGRPRPARRRRWRRRARRHAPARARASGAASMSGPGARKRLARLDTILAVTLAGAAGSGRFVSPAITRRAPFLPGTGVNRAFLHVSVRFHFEGRGQDSRHDNASLPDPPPPPQDKRMQDHTGPSRLGSVADRPART